MRWRQWRLCGAEGVSVVLTSVVFTLLFCFLFCLLTPSDSRARAASSYCPTCLGHVLRMEFEVRERCWGARVTARKLVLRGGGNNESRTEFFSEDPRPSGPVQHVVPMQYESLLDCIYDARSGDSIFLQRLKYNYRTYEGGEWGWHTWIGMLFVTNECLWRSRKKGFPHSGAKTLEELRAFYREADRAGSGLIKLEQTVIRGLGELYFMGAPGVKVSGQIVLAANTTGAFRGPMTLALLSDCNFLFQQNDMRYCHDVKAAVSVHSAWRFDNCSIRASGGTALRCDRASDVRLEGCAVGGLLAYDVDGRLCKAARAVSLVKQARCVLVGCAIEHTEVHKYNHRGGVAVKVSQEAEVVLEDCILHSHDGVCVLFDEFDDLGERYENKARVRIANAAIKQCGVSAFSSRGNTLGALLHVRSSAVYGANLWANADRPGQVEWVDNCGGEELMLPQAPGNGHAASAPECYRSMFWYKPKTPALVDVNKHERVDWKKLFQVDTLSDSEDVYESEGGGERERGQTRITATSAAVRERAQEVWQEKINALRSVGVDVDAIERKLAASLS